jgi:ABC-2 type transport system permease protein
MFESLEPYLAIFRIGIKDNLAYKTDFALTSVFRLAGSLVMLLVWTAIYLASHATSIGGFTLTAIYAYFFLINAVHYVIYSNIDEFIQDDVQSGSVASSLIKPIRYPLNLLFRTLSENALLIVVASLPLFAIVAAFYPLNLNAESIALLLAVVVIGNIVVMSLDFLIGSLSIYMTNIYGIMSVFWGVVSLLSGGIIPLSLFSQQTQSILFMLPFQLLAYTPASILLGTISYAQAIHALFFGAAWAAGLSVFAYFWWERSVKKVMSAGG